MQRALFLLLIIFLMKTWSQSCNERDRVTKYHLRDRVVFHHKVYGDLPLSPNLKINVSHCGGVKVDKFPDGTIGTLGMDTTVFFSYPAHTKVKLSAQPSAECRFVNWQCSYLSSWEIRYSPTIEMNVDTPAIVYALFDTLRRDSVLVHLSATGRLVVNPTISGTIDTFTVQNGRSVLLEFNEYDNTILTALPEPGYEFVDWGDSLHTAANPLKLTFGGSNRELFPSYDIASEQFKVPSLCNAENNMQVNGRSRFYGAVNTGSDFTVRGGLNVLGKDGSSPYCKVTSRGIDLNSGNRTIIDDSSITTTKVDADSVQTEALYVNEILKADSIITGRVLVDIAAEQFPDYVFDAYHLRSIDELETYITQNGKLPEFPSAQEVQNKGLDMGRVCTDVLKRIEETTLYLIELNKRIDALEKRESAVYQSSHLHDGFSNPAVQAITGTHARDSLVKPIVLCTLTVNLSAHGSVVVDTMPDGKVITFNIRDAGSVSFVYTENARLTLIAIPDSGYAFADWGDREQSPGKSMTLTMDTNYTVGPVFQSGTTTWKTPSQTGVSDNMTVDGRTRLYAAPDFLDGQTVDGTITIKDQAGYGSPCTITSDNIWIGNTAILRDAIYAKSIISKTASTRSLQTNNEIRVDKCVAGKVRVTTDVFPDFVFEPGYCLTSLTAVDQYINEHKHLENIPTAAEISKDKVDVGDMYVRLLRKVEENMLYVIELQKRVELLRKGIDLQRKNEGCGQ